MSVEREIFAMGETWVIAASNIPSSLLGPFIHVMITISHIYLVMYVHTCAIGLGWFCERGCHSSSRMT